MQCRELPISDAVDSGEGRWLAQVAHAILAQGQLRVVADEGLPPRPDGLGRPILHAGAGVT